MAGTGRPIQGLGQPETLQGTWELGQKAEGGEVRGGAPYPGPAPAPPVPDSRVLTVGQKGLGEEGGWRGG